MTKEGSAKIVNFIFIEAEGLMLGHGCISHYSEYILSSTLSIYIVLNAILWSEYNAVSSFHCLYLFYHGAADIQIWALLTRSQCKFSDTQATVKALGSLVLNEFEINVLQWISSFLFYFIHKMKDHTCLFKQIIPPSYFSSIWALQIFVWKKINVCQLKSLNFLKGEQSVPLSLLYKHIFVQASLYGTFELRIRSEFSCSNEVIVGHISLPHYRETVKSMYMTCLL